MGHTLSKLTYHCVFSTKDRRALIKDGVRERLYPYIGSIIRANKGALMTIGGTPDHVHVLMELPAAVSVADAMRLIKTNASKWVRETFATHSAFAWQTGYGAFSVSASVVGDVTRYIENQENHHRTQTFEAEFIALLERHGVAYDERYMWG